jgi:pyruvate kinase|tara:strand:- start:312 stop:617 length:306 start_codon:yes stop_codon:yes gene_type:complete
MDQAGVDMFRINMSHTNINDFKSIVEELQGWTQKPICPDIEGVQIRNALGTDYVSTDSKKILDYFVERTDDKIEYFIKKENPRISANPRIRKHVALLKKMN